MSDYDFVIVGGGALGLSIAYKLAQRSSPTTKIAVVNYNNYPAASTAAGAMLGCFGEVTKQTFIHEARSAKFDMMFTAHKLWPEWIAELNTHAKCPVISGTHIVLNTQGGRLDEENYEAVIDTLQEYKEPYDLINPRDIEGLKPTELQKPLKALFLPNEHALDSHRYLEVLHKACENSRVIFRQMEIEKIEKNTSGYILRGRGGEEEIQANEVILAAGAATSEILHKSNLDVCVMPIFAGTGVALATQRVSGASFNHTIRTANRAGSCGLHLIPLGNGREYLGATNVVMGTYQTQASNGISLFLSRCAINQLSRTLQFSKIEQWRVGNRPVSLDTLPLIGKTSEKGLYIATGTYRDGLHCSPIIAESLVNEIFGKKRLISELFVPERRPIALMTKEESIENLCDSEICSAYEDEMFIPNYLEFDLVADRFRKMAEEAYARLEDKIVLDPDILCSLFEPESGQEIKEAGEASIITYLTQLENRGNL